jgi:hypothetical protein
MRTIFEKGGLALVARENRHIFFWIMLYRRNARCSTAALWMNAL